MLLTECQHSTTCFATSMTQCILNHRHPPTFFFLHGSEAIGGLHSVWHLSTPARLWTGLFVSPPLPRFVTFLFTYFSRVCPNVCSEGSGTPFVFETIWAPASQVSLCHRRSHNTTSTQLSISLNQGTKYMFCMRGSSFNVCVACRGQLRSPELASSLHSQTHHHNACPPCAFTTSSDCTNCMP
jgi:hypothetical protein